MNYILAHDVGTGGTKAILVTERGEIVASSFEAYSTQYPHPKWVEQNPADWWHAVALTSRRLLEVKKIPPEKVIAVTFASQMLGVLPVDEGGTPLRPAIIWLDLRASEEAQAMMRKVGGPGIFARIAGTAITGKDVIPKMIWLKNKEPDVYRRTTVLLDVSGYLLYRATGRLVYEWTCASATGLFSLKHKTWDTGIMRLFGLSPDKFPELVPSTSKVGGLTRAAAAECGLLEGTPVNAGAGDAPAAAVGSGAVGEGASHINLGTSGWVGIVTSRPVMGKRGIVTIQSADPAKLFLIAETETAGACLEWAARELYQSEPGSEIFTRMDAEVAAVEPGAEGLLFTPWMYGERCPVADEYVRSAFLNLCHIHRREQMTRAIYEGVAYNLRWMIDSIAELYHFHPASLRAIGGGALGLPWLQIIADVCGRTIESVPDPQDAGAVGVALVAAVGSGILPSFEAIQSLVQPDHRITPDPKPVYDEMYAAYKKVYPALYKLYRSLNR